MDKVKIAGIIYLIISGTVYSLNKEHCTKAFGCLGESKLGTNSKYILYDVNIGEGFNLKRDVYMRMATFVRKLAHTSEYDWHLVLPPWSKQWHWTSENNQVSFQWNNFFDVSSLQLYSPVIEIEQYYADLGNSVDEVYILQHFPEFYEWTGDDNIDWTERWQIAKCRDHQYWKYANGSNIFFRGKNKVKAKHVKCISFQGSAAYLGAVISSSEAKSIMFDRAEIATHISYGDSEYWMCRRSMRFSKHLVHAAQVFRAAYLNSSDEHDGTIHPLDWRDEHPHRTAIGGPYLGVHLRRKDFVRGRLNEVPSLEQIVQQISKYLYNTNLSVVFISTDMDSDEYVYIENSLSTLQFRTVKYHTDNEMSDGELAIIDQIIASYARIFIGTHESTFSYRIQEEREIMGFSPETTFNRFCPWLNQTGCTPPTKWLIQYPTESSYDKDNKYFREGGEL